VPKKIIVAIGIIVVGMLIFSSLQRKNETDVPNNSQSVQEESVANEEQPTEPSHADAINQLELLYKQRVKEEAVAKEEFRHNFDKLRDELLKINSTYSERERKILKSHSRPGKKSRLCRNPDGSQYIAVSEYDPKCKPEVSAQ